MNDTVEPLDRIEKALEAANIPSLVATLAHLTADDRWLQAPYTPARARGLDDNDSGGLDPERQREVRQAVIDVLAAHRNGTLVPAEPGPERVAHILAVALGEDVPAEYGEILSEELGIRSRDVTIGPAARDGFHVVIIGAGIAGIGAAIKLKQAGIDFTVIEKNTTIGGTWYENTYPGCGVDTPGHLYSYSFDPNIEWTRYFAKQPEVWQYLERLTDKYGIREHIRFGYEVVTADYSDDGSWTVVASGAEGDRMELRGNALVPAVGMINRPSVPPIKGLDTFAGPKFHTAQWDPSVDLTGKRVAIIGNGATAMQLVPTIADAAESVTIFQRSKQWVVPHPNYQREVSDDVRLVMKEVPFYAGWYRLRAFWNFSDRLHPQVQVDPAWEHQDRSVNEVNEKHRVFLTRYLTEQLADRPDLIEKCLPDYPPYGKRPLIDNGWFTAIRCDDVHLVTDAVEEVVPNGVRTADGVVHEADVLLLATGFRALQFLWPMEIRGRSGQTLAEVWGPNDARAYLGLTVPDFPNMFILNGPNTNAGHGGSAYLAIEFQIRYLMQALDHLCTGTADSLEVRDEVFWGYNRELDEGLGRSVWAHPGMSTYYRNGAGRVVVTSPWTYLDYWRRTSDFNPDDFVVSQGAESLAGAAESR
ncbi:monooxygenase [Mycolicibacterium fortuitum]|uniref:Monooxygenase n=1 Tax=Mycolicibacterium fortuitum TaxID=1766 RepID=A0ABD6QC64_MYCFO|nr:NAD(P)/FAD-dependent oxidoreductase [Mycolicibacterium fortuitum]OMC33118.1 monooxygenase [Mycolicibacterium fortuitum]